MIIAAGKLNVTVPVYFVDDVSGTNTGEPTTGLLFSDIETGGSASYQRQGAARVDFTLVTQTVTGAHTDGGFIQIDSTNMPGGYRLDVPDAAFATGVDFVIIQLVAASGNNTVMRPIVIDLTIDLTGAVIAANVTQWNGAAVAVPSVAGVPEVDITHQVGGLVPAPFTTGIPDVNLAQWVDNVPGGVSNGRIPSNMGAISGDSAAADNLESDYDGSGYNKVASQIATVATLTGHTPQTGDSFARIGANGAGLTSINLPNQTMDITGNITGNLSGSVGSVTGAVGSVTGAVGSVTGAVGSVAGNVDGNVTGTVSSVVTKTGYALVSTGADLILSSSTFALAMADAIWDELLAGHVIADSTGLLLNDWQDGGRLDVLLDAIPTTAMRGTDSALLAASAPTNFGDLAITVTTGQVTVGTNNDKTGYAIGTGGIGVGAFAANALRAADINADVGQEFADAFLTRNLAGGSDAGFGLDARSVANALRGIRNRREIAGGTLSVYRENDSTVAWTAAVTTTAGNPITEVDPT